MLEDLLMAAVYTEASCYAEQIDKRFVIASNVRMKNIQLMFALLIFGSTSAQAFAPIDPPEISPGFVKVGDLKPTFYWVALEEFNGTGPKTKTLKNLDGEVLAQVSEPYWRSIRMEGTGRLLDGKVLNFDAFVDLPGGGRDIAFKVCGPEAPYGYGLNERPLRPFRSAAVDPRVIPMDSLLFIPAAKGTRLPDGAIHDGYFWAEDIGAAIQHQRIDIFTSFGDQSEVFQRHGLISMKKTAVYVKIVTKNR